MTFVRAVPDDAFKKCCMGTGAYDGSPRNHFFSPINDELASRRGWRTRVPKKAVLVYLRFVVAKIDPDSERALGVFQAAGYLRDEGDLYPFEVDQHDIVRKWFNENLETPRRFTAAKAPFYRKKQRALCWFKDTATVHLARVRELFTILENHGFYVWTLKARRVGYIVYEDEYQVTAEPYADMICRVE